MKLYFKINILNRLYILGKLLKSPILKRIKCHLKKIFNLVIKQLFKLNHNHPTQVN